MIDPGAGSVVIAGGGVIGAGIAFELAQRGVAVTLVERGRIGGEASWASAGIVSLPNRPWMKPERVELGRLSLDRYPALVAELEERTGLAIDYRRPGEWVIAVDDEHAEAERARRSPHCRNLWSRPGFTPTSVPSPSTG
jgi:glycine oxidase